MIKVEKNEEMIKVIDEELKILYFDLHKIEPEIKQALIPKDKNDSKNVIIEIRAGTGGDEAALFATSLLRMYEKYVVNKKFNFEIISLDLNGIGGIKEVIGSISGKSVFKNMKFESGFVSVDIPENNSVMLSSLAGSTMGIWVAHGEGKFKFDNTNDINVVSTYTYSTYPANPNGSDMNTMGIASKDGRILAMMPHLERSVFPWNWAHYPNERQDEVSPWIRAFENAYNWISEC